jgi:hypothetical protein
MEVLVLGKQSLHELPANTLSMMSGMDQHMRKVDNQMTVRDGVG